MLVDLSSFFFSSSFSVVLPESLVLAVSVDVVVSVSGGGVLCVGGNTCGGGGGGVIGISTTTGAASTVPPTNAPNTPVAESVPEAENGSLVSSTQPLQSIPLTVTAAVEITAALALRPVRR